MSKGILNESASEFSKELARQIPVRQAYDDAISLSAKETGSILADLAKTLHLALAPIQYFGALQDRFRSFLDKAVRRVPEERRVTPPPQILGPVIEGIRYEPEGTPIDEMFSQLLSRAMDRDHINEAHPAYALLIRQLAPDEARILSLLLKRNFSYQWTRDYNHKTRLFGTKITIEIDDLPRTDLVFANNVKLYIQHLFTLGLAGIFDSRQQEPLFETIVNQDHSIGVPDSRQVQVGIRSFQEYRLTDWGRSFVEACSASQT